MKSGLRNLTTIPTFPPTAVVGQDATQIVLARTLLHEIQVKPEQIRYLVNEAKI
jgi:hypothetical protein